MTATPASGRMLARAATTSTAGREPRGDWALAALGAACPPQVQRGTGVMAPAIPPSGDTLWAPGGPRTRSPLRGGAGADSPGMPRLLML